jgi:hypothetical protein
MLSYYVLSTDSISLKDNVDQTNFFIYIFDHYLEFQLFLTENVNF